MFYTKLHPGQKTQHEERILKEHKESVVFFTVQYKTGGDAGRKTDVPEEMKWIHS